MITRMFSLGLILLSSSFVFAEGKRYLIQFKPSHSYYAMAALTAQRPDIKVVANLKNIQTLVVESGNELAIEALRSDPRVDVIEEDFVIPAPPRISTRGASVFSRKPPRALAMEMPWGIEAVHAPQAWTMTRGQGVRVMVLDTGIDQSHDALVSRFEKGKNFTGGSSADIADEVGHGTHVSGTILADGANGGLVGVAPDAQLLMGKVCGAGGCEFSAIAAGIDWAISERVDVINMSLGGSFMTPAERNAIDRAEAMGIIVVAASGNDGTNKVSFPAAYQPVVAVGAVDSTLNRADFSQYGPELDVVAPGVDVVSSVPKGTGRGGSVEIDVTGKGLESVKSMPLQGAPLFKKATKQLVFVGLGKSYDFNGVNLRGKFALIQRGEITFKEKTDNAIKAGATGVIIFNNEPGLIQGGLTEDGSEVAVPVTMIEKAVGEAARDLLSRGQAVEAAISIDTTDYSSFQGTSMASPHVAGVVALIRAANKNLSAAQVKSILLSTATALGTSNDNQYGSGIVNAEAAVNRALVTSGSVEGLRTAN